MTISEYEGIKYETFGTGTTILFIHGLFLDRVSTREFFEKNSSIKQFKRIYIDLPGMGDSIPNAIASSDAIFNKITRLIDHIIEDNPFIVYGHSYGGYLAQAIAHQYQNQVRAVLVTCPVVIANSEKRVVAAHKNKVIEKLMVTSNSDFIEDFKQMNVIIDQDSWLSYQKLFLSGIKKADIEFLKKLQRNGYTLSFEDQLTHFGPDTQVTFLLGRFDHVVGYKQQVELISKNEKGDIVVVDDAGHNLMIDQPDIVNFYFDRLIQKVIK